MFVIYYWRDRNQAAQPGGWQGYCDLCKTWIGERALKTTVEHYHLPGDERLHERVTHSEAASERHTFWEWVDELRSNGHAIPRGSITVVAGKSWQPWTQVNLVCRDCLEKHGLDI